MDSQTARPEDTQDKLPTPRPPQDDDDLLDEALDESFPASDPPSTTPPRA